MARKDGALVLKFSTSGAARTERQLTEIEMGLDRAIRETFKEIAPEITRIYRELSPSTRLARGIVPSTRSFSKSRPTIDIISTYRDTSGYDPLPITRFGHRKRFIVPRNDRGDASVISKRTRRAPFRDQRPALSFSSNGMIYFRYRVRGQRRTHDWVRDARGRSDAILERATERLGRKVVSSL